MKKYWLLLADRFDAMAPRERLLVFLAAVAVCAGIFVLAVVDPALARYQKASAKLQQSHQGVQQVDAAELLLIDAASRDPDAEVRGQIDQARKQLEARQGELGLAGLRLGKPEQRVALLRDLIGAQRGLELVSIKSGAVQDLLGAASAPAADGAGLYQHSVELTVRGDFAALGGYLHALEALPEPMRPAKLELVVEQYPKALMTLTLNLISVERAWLVF